MHDNGTMVGFPAGTIQFFLIQNVQTITGSCSGAYSMAPRHSFPGIKWLEHETDHSPPLLHVELHLKSYTCLHGTQWELINLLVRDVVLTSRSEKAKSSEQSSGSIYTWRHINEKIQTIMSVANYCNFFYLTSPVICHTSSCDLARNSKLKTSITESPFLVIVKSSTPILILPVHISCQNY